MKIIRPVTVDDARLASTNVGESEYTAYDTDATYAARERCYVPDNHTVYEALTEVSGVDPVSDVATAETPSWITVGATNRWAMFDGQIGTATTAAEPWSSGDGQGIQVEIEPGSTVTGMALFGLLADAVTVEVIDPAEGVVYASTRSLVSSNGIDNWHAWFFEPIEHVPDLVFDDLPSYGTARVRISIARDAAAASCSLVVLGAQRDIGTLKWRPTVGITDYSKKERDTFGRPVVVPRAFSKILSADIDVDSPRVDAVQRLLAGYRSTPLVWVGAPQYGSTIIYGYYRSFSIVLDNLVFSECSIDIEGLNE